MVGEKDGNEPIAAADPGVTVRFRSDRKLERRDRFSMDNAR